MTELKVTRLVSHLDFDVELILGLIRSNYVYLNNEAF